MVARHDFKWVNILFIEFTISRLNIDWFTEYIITLKYIWIFAGIKWNNKGWLFACGFWLSLIEVGVLTCNFWLIRPDELLSWRVVHRPTLCPQFAFHKAGPDVDKSLDPVRVFIQRTTNIFEIIERRYFEHFGRTSKSARYTGWLFFRVWKVITHILKWMRNLTGNQCNRFRIGMERLERGALVTTLARQFWMCCNLAISFPGIL